MRHGESLQTADFSGGHVDQHRVIATTLALNCLGDGGHIHVGIILDLSSLGKC